MTPARPGTQDDVVASSDPVLLVLGGAGVGKTTAAARAAAKYLEDAERHSRGVHPERVLFLSFSRASVAQILSRSSDVLGRHVDHVEVTTFHALAWRLVERYGPALGHAAPSLRGETHGRLFPSVATLRYADLVPLALQAAALPAVASHLKRRWGLIVCDEYQDTSDDQYALILALRGDARLLLLGDPNQCIYTGLPGVRGVGEGRLAAALSLPGARRIDLPEASHREPTQVLPAAAAAIRRREFSHPSVMTALNTGRLEVRAGLDPATEAQEVAATVARLRADGTVAIFSHHVDTTTDLSDELVSAGVGHEVVGLPESLGAALDAQAEMVAFSLNDISETTWRRVLDSLAVFVASSVRGASVPELARMLVGQAPPGALKGRLDGLRTALAAALPEEATALAAAAHTALGISRGDQAWERAGELLRPMLRACMRGAPPKPQVALRLREQVDRRRASLLTYETADQQQPIQLMGLYQSKGREADSTIVVLRDSDFFGSRYEPFELGSRLLYVLYTRARNRTCTLAFGSELHPLVAPLARLNPGV